MDALSRLPYQPPHWLTPERIATAAGALGGAQTALFLMFHESWLDQLVVTLYTAVATALTVHRATRRGTTVGDALFGTLRCFPLGTALAAVTLVCGYGVASGAAALFHALPWMPVVALGGLCAGVLLAPVVLPLALVAAAGRTRPSHDASVRALVGAGVWLAALAVALGCIDHQPAWMLLPGPLTAAAGLLWLTLRARFVRRVRAGAAPGFVVVESDAEVLATGLLPYTTVRQPSAIDAIAGALPASGGVYRDDQRHVPLCLLARPR